MKCNHIGIENAMCNRCSVLINPKIDYAALESWTRSKTWDQRLAKWNPEQDDDMPLPVGVPRLPKRKVGSKHRVSSGKRGS